MELANYLRNKFTEDSPLSPSVHDRVIHEISTKIKTKGEHNFAITDPSLLQLEEAKLKAIGHEKQLKKKTQKAFKQRMARKTAHDDLADVRIRRI